MMTLDYVGDREAMAYAQLGQHPSRRRVMGDRSFCPVIVRQRQRNARPKPRTTIVEQADIKLHSTGDTTPTR